MQKLTAKSMAQTTSFLRYLNLGDTSRGPSGDWGRLVNRRKARITEVGLADAVPGKIVACLRPSKAFRAIRSSGMLAFSARLAGPDFSFDDPFDLYEFMSDSDHQNLVFACLQYLGRYVLPGTSTVTHERCR